MTAEPPGSPPVAPRPLTPDPFQVRAIEALDAGRSVVVSAPTGAGKTLIAEHALDRTLATGGRAFYTTPVKALSNQKHRDFAARWGADRVGLLTGDTSRNPAAPVVVMTTEVLRNMCYTDPARLEDLRVVVLDEIHFLADPYRGPVWEEVILGVSPATQLVCLSATISNADQLGDWIEAVHGPVTVVTESRRPVPLTVHYAVGERHAGIRTVEVTRDGRPNPEGFRFDPPRPPRGHRGRRGPSGPWVTPRRADMVNLLRRSRLLPALWFLFSRAGCDRAAAALARTGPRLNTPEEADRARAIAESHLGVLDPSEREVLGLDEQVAALGAGVAAHHAGLIPLWKEVVEECFAAGVVKVVFATETLAVGINMPARTVVVEQLSKFTGEHHRTLTPTELTQLTGRAGRRGLDPEGHAFILWSPFVPFAEVARLVTATEHPLRSAFRPTYNMAANLVGTLDREQAHRVVGRSFGQFQRDAALVGLERELTELRAEMVALLARVGPHREALEEYRRLAGAGAGGPATDLGDLSPGDVVGDARRPGRWLAVLSVADRRSGPRVRAVDERGGVRVLGPGDVAAGGPVGRVRLPAGFLPRHPDHVREVADRLRRTARRLVRRRLTRHPLHDHPERDDLLAAAARVERLRGRIARTERAIRSRAGSLAGQLDRVVGVLEEVGAVRGWTLTPVGTTLRRVFHDQDLLVTLTVTGGLLDDLTAEEVVALVSALTYQHRSSEPAVPWTPTTRAAARLGEIERLAGRILAAEAPRGLTLTRPPDAGFARVVVGWLRDDPLEDLLVDVAPGELVRNIRQVIDLLDQLGEVAPPAVARVCRDARRRLDRGLVAMGTAGP